MTLPRGDPSGGKAGGAPKAGGGREQQQQQGGKGRQGGGGGGRVDLTPLPEGSAGAEFAKAANAWSRGDTDDARIKVTRTIKAGPAASCLHTSPQAVSSCCPDSPRAVCPVGTRPETTAVISPDATPGTRRRL